MIKPILLFNNPSLTVFCDKVCINSNNTVNEYHNTVVRDLLDTLVHKGKKAVGLAANQIGYHDCIIAVKDVATDKIEIMLNPEILEYSKEVNLDYEACLSYPNLTKRIARPSMIKIRGWVIDTWEGDVITFTKVERTEIAYQARIYCHEIDHILGRCKVGTKK